MSDSSTTVVQEFSVFRVCGKMKTKKLFREEGNMKDKFYLSGDLHGDSSAMQYFFEQNNERLHFNKEHSHMILLGDVGCNYFIEGEKDKVFKKRLSELPFTFICLRGNHESRVTDVIKRFPDKWEIVSKYEGRIYREKAFQNIEYLEDIPALYHFGGYKILSIPGAFSVDKEFRLRNGWHWFENEQLSKEEMRKGIELVEKAKYVDLVISHTCPADFMPTDLFINSIDQSKAYRGMEVFLSEVEWNLRYKRWAWGHFHDDRLYPRKDDTERIMLYSKVIDLDKFIQMGRTDSLQDILA